MYVPGSMRHQPSILESTTDSDTETDMEARDGGNRIQTRVIFLVAPVDIMARAAGAPLRNCSSDCWKPPSLFHLIEPKTINGSGSWLFLWSFPIEVA
jgi:hypothetical protein